jgi:hypothetical protein
MNPSSKQKELWGLTQSFDFAGGVHLRLSAFIGGERLSP